MKTFFGFYIPEEFYASESHLPNPKAHNRLVTHQIDIHQIINPHWAKSGKSKNSLIIPHGENKHIHSIDLGKLLLGKIPGAKIEETIEEQVIIQLPDKTFIKGTHYRKIPLEELDLTEAKEYLNIDANSSTTNPQYIFSLKTSEIHESKALFFTIQEYTTIDNTRTTNSTINAFSVKNKFSYGLRFK